MTAARKKSPAKPLTRERIVKSALGIVDRDGLKALSMRRLGAELGVDPMAIYYHVPNKEALFDAIVEAVMAEIDLTVDNPTDPAEERILGAARAYRDAMLAHANALPIVLSRGPRTPVAMRPVELLIGILRDAGLPPSQAMAGMNAIAATVRGTIAMVADEQAEPPSPEEMRAMAEAFPPDEFPHLLEVAMCPVDFLNADFEFGIRALARGLLGSVEA
jgi:TetR/AcrR family transcriptional regulator, tetracycline repressor protein